MGQDDLRQVLSRLPESSGVADLLVGHSTNDDAAVLRIDGQRAIVQTVDFFTPIVDDPRLFGAIAVANSVSDVYAMGATPILGLSIAAFPVKKLPLSVLEEILAGAGEKAREAGFPIGGGHTIIDDVPKYGLAVTGLVDIDRVVRNSTARPGDALYLTKPIGNGIIVCAFRADSASSAMKKLVHRAGVPEMEGAVDWMLKLNAGAAGVMSEVGASAATDVTGYGLVGHLLEMCCEAGARISLSAVPLLEGAREWMERGFVPEGTKRNERAFRPRVRSSVDEAGYRLLCDAQTSGGLLIAIPPDREKKFEQASRESGLFCARIGHMTEETGIVEIVP